MILHRLTEGQRNFADTHHGLVYRFLSRYGLDCSEYYDIAIFGYLHAVQLYDEREDLKKYSFSTIAFINMRQVALRYMRSVKYTASLDAPITEDGNLTLQSLIADPRDDYSAILDRDEAEWMLEHCSEKGKRLLTMQAMGYTHKDMAKICGLTMNDIRHSIPKARMKISKAYTRAV